MDILFAVKKALKISYREINLVRVENTIVDSLDLPSLNDIYKQSGYLACHPWMILKVMIYSCSSRMIAKTLLENINFMRITGENKPDLFWRSSGRKQS